MAVQTPDDSRCTLWPKIDHLRGMQWFRHQSQDSVWTVWYWKGLHLRKWKEVPAAQVSCGPAFTHTELKPTWLSTSSNHGGRGHQASMGGGVINQLWGGPSAKYGGAISQVWGGHQPSMGGAISQVWGGSSAKYGGVINQLWGGPSAKYGGGYLFSHQYVQELKIQRITLATHTSCLL